MTKINSNNIIKSPQDLGCICGAHHCVSISQLLRLLGAPAKPENLECRWISLWDSLPLGPAVAMNSLMMPPPGIPPHLTPPPQKSWHCNSHKSLLSWLGLKKLGRRKLLSILWEKDWLLTQPRSPPPSPAGLQEHAEHLCLEQRQIMETGFQVRRGTILKFVWAIVPIFFVSIQRLGNLC